MKIEWVAHLSDEKDKKNFKEFVKSSTPVLSRLADMLEKRKLNVEVFKAEDYNSLSWAYACADRNGYVRALNEILNLIKEEGTTDDHSTKRKR